jgi:lipoyl(octanoyl) transferase
MTTLVARAASVGGVERAHTGRMELEVVRSGLVPYAEAWAAQRARAEAVRDAGAAEALFVLQHPPVYTLGMRGRTASVVASDAVIAARGAEVVQSDRGGDVTFHGPGQLVAYPVLDLHRRDLGPAAYVRLVEACAIETLAAFGVAAERVPGRPGVWVRESQDGGALAKIAAVGVRVRRGVSTHGIALNVSTDLDWYDAIVPCGIADAGVTSLARVLDAAPSHAAVEAAFIAAFARMFHVEHLDVAEAGVR